jgi:beta-lactamase superfamily II metal-dependent hydrolase
MEEQFPGYHPVIQMAGISQDETVEIGHRIACAKEVAQYLYPKRKAVEHSNDNSLVIVVSEDDKRVC